MAGFDNRSGFAFGDIVLAPCSIPDRQAVENRPSVIVSSSTYNQQRGEVLTMALAVRKRPNTSSGEMTVLEPENAGLDRGAVFNPVVTTVDQRHVRLILGRLVDRDRERLCHLLDLILGK